MDFKHTYTDWHRLLTSFTTHTHTHTSVAYKGEEKVLRNLRVKTFFRRGMAKQVIARSPVTTAIASNSMPTPAAPQAMGWYEEALGDFDSALVLEPQNKRSALALAQDWWMDIFLSAQPLSCRRAKASREQLARALSTLPEHRTVTTAQLSELFKRCRPE